MALTPEQQKVMETFLAKLKSQGHATVRAADGTQIFYFSRGTVEKMVENLKGGKEYVSIVIADQKTIDALKPPTTVQ